MQPNPNMAFVSGGGSGSAWNPVPVPSSNGSGQDPTPFPTSVPSERTGSNSLAARIGQNSALHTTQAISNGGGGSGGGGGTPVSLQSRLSGSIAASPDGGSYFPTNSAVAPVPPVTMSANDTYMAAQRYKISMRMHQQQQHEQSAQQPQQQPQQQQLPQ
jgi:hypothetical protein